MKLAQLKPDKKEHVVDCLKLAGIKVPRNAAKNTSFLTQAAFEYKNIVVLNFWLGVDIVEQGKNIIIQKNLREAPQGKQKAVHHAIKSAIEKNLKIRIIVLEGKPAPKGSEVSKRSLDPMPWSVKSYNEKTGQCVLVRDIHPDDGLIPSPRVRHYWVVSPNIKRNENTVKMWSKASVHYRVAFMGYEPDDPEHKSGLKFAGTQDPHILGIMPDDCILIARRHEGKRQVVAFGVVQGEHIKINQLKGFKPPEEDGDSGSLRYLDPFITDYNEPPRSLIDVLPSRGRALRWLDPEKDAHKKICNWMEFHLRDREMRARPSDPVAASSISISPLTFNRQFERFKTKVLHSSNGQPFVSFRDGLPAEMEDYKEDVRDEALRLLGFTRWKRSDVGTGRILNCVIQAIEIHDSSRNLRNNLVAWQAKGFSPKSRSHLVFLKAGKSSATRRELEVLLWDFYQNRIGDGEAFEQFGLLGVTRYDLIAYMFFLKDWNRFMPIAPMTFDDAFNLLGVDLVTAHQCSWENYLNYNNTLLEVQRLLREVAEVPDARLIDAHSFCWMLARMELHGAAPAPIIPLPRVVTNIQPVTAQITDQEGEGGHAVVTDEQFAERDEQRRRLGKLAQDVALQSERRRLRKSGHSNPSKAVRPVWDEPSRHYDILSCELDGSPRHIEVKSARKTGEKLSFFLSRYEWKESRTKPNYWFYLVLDSESSHPDVLMIAANDLSLDCLAPVNYLASIREPQS
jgi:hypothetical protein